MLKINEINCCVLYVIIFKIYLIAAHLDRNEVILVHRANKVMDEIQFNKYFTGKPTQEEQEEDDESTIILESNRPVMPPRPVIKTLKDVQPNDTNNQNFTTICKAFRRGSQLDIKLMVDVWEVVYYKLPHNIDCFKFVIEQTSFKDRKNNYDLFGDLSSNINWNFCHLEVKPFEPATNRKKHYLHGVDQSKGILDNVITEVQIDKNGKVSNVVRKESADQWLVVKNLLLMRDCETGDIVVFGKVNMKPRREDILDAMMIFGEDRVDGNMNCNRLKKIMD